METSREDRIRQHAYALWEKAGRPEGKHDEHWTEASRAVGADAKAGSAQAGSSAGAQSAAAAGSNGSKPSVDRLTDAQATAATMSEGSRAAPRSATQAEAASRKPL